MSALSAAAAQFHDLHRGPGVLLLPNAWDVVSARMVEEAGAKAVATSSAALAWAHGYADGHDLPIARLVESVKEIVRIVRIPVSVDAEGGYADDPATVENNIAALIQAGAIGINLEDGHGAHELHLRKIEGARRASEREGVDLFINARTDVFLHKLAPPEGAVEETIKRGLAAKNAGASGLFVPALVVPDQIAAIVAAVDLPLNVLAWPNLPNAAALAGLGVRRLSAGALIGRVALAAARSAAEAMLREGDSAALYAAAGPSVNYNALMQRG